jgi:hypothetical protein
MHTAGPQRIDVPEQLREKLLAFRQRVWTVKLLEALGGAIVGVLCGYLLTYLCDRLIDTPALVRGLILTTSIVVCACVPWAIHHWIWRRRRLDQLARLLTETDPQVGDQLLGVIELAENGDEQNRSPQLVAAAMRQVAETAAQRDFSTAVPRPRHRRNLIAAGSLAAVAVFALVGTTAAARNAWQRFLAPWQSVPRYTFAAIEPLPERLVVPHGEEFTVPVQLTDHTEWKPNQAEVTLAGLAPVTTARSENRYQFTLPGQIQPGRLDVRVGDYRGETVIDPQLRPELTELQAEIRLPGYLGRTENVTREIRGGRLSAVTGSVATFSAEISRELAAAWIDQRPAAHEHTTIFSGPVAIDSEHQLEWSWTDTFGLTGQKPFALSLAATPDEAPSVLSEGLPRKKVLLDSEVLTFRVRARDDFGVKRVGIAWQGLTSTGPSSYQGEATFGAGDAYAELLELDATFSAKQFDIPPQAIEVRLFVEDFHPDRERVYGPPSTFFVLDPEQHAIWVTDQLSRWQRLALDVRDRERQLHETNKQLRMLDPAELDNADTRREIKMQAAAEQANGRRLDALVNSGEDLLKQAMRNQEIGVGHLDRWAEMMQILKEISGQRMPSVADLLKDASNAEPGAQLAAKPRSPQAGENRANTSGGSGKKTKPGEPPQPVPTLTDVESTRNEIPGKQPGDDQESKPKQSRLTLPTTMLAGNGQAPPKPKTPAGEKVDEAVREQQDLLAEFEKIANELNEILANLEGSTLVKRLKAASREQEQVAQDLGEQVTAAFGLQGTGVNSAVQQSFRQLAETEEFSSQKVSYIMDDMAAYFERSRFQRFQEVLEEMREENVVGGLRGLSEELAEENGLAIAQAEYWSETLDRWAEDLVEVTKCGACPGCKSKGSLPPSIVLEVLQILEGEMNLREQTRVAQQARAAVSADDHQQTATRLSETQTEYKERIDKVIERILELPDAESDFGKEIKLLRMVAPVMQDAADILADAETGAAAIAAETEAIELLLQSKRFNPNGGGGGGSSPGGGGGGDTNVNALALVGQGTNEKEVKEAPETLQATGQTGVSLPAEFRAGLDRYFERIDQPE